jgi:hypothetical protein
MKNKTFLTTVVLLFLGISACTKKVHNDSLETGNTKSSVSGDIESKNKPEEALNSIGIPMRLPYAADLEAFHLVNCKLSRSINNEIDTAVLQERGRIISRLQEYEKKYKGKNLEEFDKWGGVAANAINNCPE